MVAGSPRLASSIATPRGIANDDVARAAATARRLAASRTAVVDPRLGVGAAPLHGARVGSVSAAIAASTPFTYRPDSSVENSRASSIASSIATATGTSPPKTIS